MTTKAIGALPLTMARAILCTNGTMTGNVVQYLVRDLEVTVHPYAQYPQALKCTFIEKGKRKRRGFWVTPSDFEHGVFQVYAADAAVPPQPFFSEPKTEKIGTGVYDIRTMTGRYSMGSREWTREWREEIQPKATQEPIFCASRDREAITC